MGVYGLVRMVVMKVHISLQAIRRELNTGLEEEPKRIFNDRIVGTW